MFFSSVLNRSLVGLRTFTEFKVILFGEGFWFVVFRIISVIFEVGFFIISNCGFCYLYFFCRFVFLLFLGFFVKMSFYVNFVSELEC